MYSFAQFNYINYLLLVAMSPVCALFFYRTLTPKFAFPKFLLCTTLYIAVTEGANVFLSHAFATSFGIHAAAFVALQTLGYCLLWRCLTKSPPARILLFQFAFIIFIAIGYSAGSLVNGLAQAAIGPAVNLPENIQKNMDVFFAEVFQAIICTVASGLIARKLYTLTVEVRWSTFAILLFAQCYAQLAIAALLTWNSNVLWNAALLCTHTLICVAADTYLLRTFRSMVRNAELEQRVALLNQQQSLERARYTAANEQMQNMRRLRHDYVNTLSTIGTLLAMDEHDKILEILNNTSCQLSKTNIVHTGNQIVDAVLYSKQLSAAERGIGLDAHLLWPSETEISDTDLMRIFANLLDNAINYCSSLPEDATRHIEVTSALQGRMLALRFTNPYFHDVPPVIPASGCEDLAAAHGHGLSIVRDIAESYGGAFTASCKNNVLTFQVLLCYRLE